MPLRIGAKAGAMLMDARESNGEHIWLLFVQGIIAQKVKNVLSA